MTKIDTLRFGKQAMRNRLTFGVAAATVCMITFWVIVGRNHPALYSYLTDESRGVELFTAVFYLASGLLLIQAYVRAKIPLLRRSLPLLLGLFFIFIAGEEESWGMWIFGFSAPEAIKSINYQNEITIHNLNLFSGLFRPRRILDAFVLIFGVFTPLLHLYHDRFRKFLSDFHVPVGPIALIIWFLAALVYERIYPIMFGSTSIDTWRHAEVSEFLFSLGFFLIVVHHLLEMRSTTPSIEMPLDHS